MPNSSGWWSGPRVKLLVNGAQVLAVDVRVNLRGRDVDMTQHLLHRPEIRAAFQQMRGERMAQRMWRDGLGDACLVDVFAEDLPRSHSRQRLAARVEKKNSLALALLELGSKLAQVDGNCSDRAATDRHQSLLGALAEYPYQVVLQHHIANTQRDPLRHAQASAVCELEHRAVAERQRLIERWRG